MAVRQSAIDLVKKQGFQNVEMMAKVADELGFEFAATVALFDMESRGRNYYGSDRNGTYADKGLVTEENYKKFRHLVIDLGHPSNGVGPSQITYAGPVNKKTGKRSGGFFVEMEKEGLEPWDIHDNMFFGVRLLKRLYASKKTWTLAGKAYNGKLSYGVTFAARRLKWRAIFLADAAKKR